MTKRILLAALLILFVAGISMARFESIFEIIGFSDDGKYVAFQTMKPYDATGTATSTIHIVDVALNDFAAEDITLTVEGELSEDELWTVVRENAGRALSKLSIVAGNIGQHLYTLEEKPPWEEATRFKKETVVNVDRGDAAESYTIEIQEQVVDNKDCQRLVAFETDARIFSLTVHGPAEPVVLQRDTVLYKSRKCPYTYAVSEVYVYGDFIAVFLNSYSMGWEGDDVYKLIVTGKLPASGQTE